MFRGRATSLLRSSSSGGAGNAGGGTAVNQSGSSVYNPNGCTMSGFGDRIWRRRQATITTTTTNVSSSSKHSAATKEYKQRLLSTTSTAANAASPIRNGSLQNQLGRSSNNNSNNHNRRKPNPTTRRNVGLLVTTGVFVWLSSHATSTISASNNQSSSSSTSADKDKKIVSVHAVRGPRASMEDRWFISDDLKFFAVYDGHGGYRVAEQAQRFLFDEFLKQLHGEDDDSDVADTEAARKEAQDRLQLRQTRSEDPKLIEQALVKSFEIVSKKVLQATYLDLEGSTAVVVYLCQNNIVTANLGDSRAIICRGSKALPLTIDHKPDSASEKKRIEDLGGKVRWHGYLGPDKLPVPGMGAYRINGNLAVSRALGDRLERPYVSSDPDITVFPRNKDDDRFIVIASDGLWDVMSSQDVVDFVRQIMAGSLGSSASHSNTRSKSLASVVPFVSSSILKKDDAIRNEMVKKKENMAQFIVEEALRRGTADNVTALVIWLR